MYETKKFIKIWFEDCAERFLEKIPKNLGKLSNERARYFEATNYPDG